MMTIYWAPARAKSLIRPPTAGSVGGWQLSTESRSRTCYHPKTAISQDQPIFHDWRMRGNKRLIFLPCSATFQKSTRAPHGTGSQFSSFPPPTALVPSRPLPPINFLHTNLCLGICFVGNHIYDGIQVCVVSTEIHHLSKKGKEKKK